MGLYFRGKYWWDRFQNPWTRKRTSFSTKETNKNLAEIIATENRARVLREEIVNQAKELKLIEIIDEYLPSRLKQKQIVSARQDKFKLGRFKKEWGNIAWQDITKKRLDDFRATMEEDVTPSTVNRYFASLRTCLGWWIENEKDQKIPRITHNPLRRKGVFLNEDGRAKDRFLEHEEKPLLYPVLPDYMRDMVIVAVKTGMRQGEQLTLKKRALNFNQKDIFLQGQREDGRTKSNRSRHIRMTPEVCEILKKWVMRHPQSEYVFCDDNGKPFSSQGIFRSDFANAREQAEANNLAPGLTWHSFRHTYGKELAEKGGHAKLIMDLMGHHSLKMVERYTHFERGEVERIVDSLEDDSRYMVDTLKLQAVG